MKTYRLPDPVVERSTIGIVMRSFNRPDYDMWLGATQAAQEQDLNVVTFVGREIDSPQSLERQANAIYELVSAEKLSGAVVMSSGLGLYAGPDGMQAFCARFGDRPLVSLQMGLPGVPSILADSYRGMREVIEHLIEAHHCRRIVFLRGPVNHRGARERYRAYRAAMDEHGIALDPGLVCPATASWSNVDGIAHMLGELSRSSPLPYDAIVGTSAGLAQEAMTWLRTHNIRVPEDVAAVGFDDFPMHAGEVPSLTTARVPFNEMGRRAINMLIAQMHGEAVPLEVMTPARLVVRESCGCPSDSVLRAGLLAHPLVVQPRHPGQADRSTVLSSVIPVNLGAQRESVIGALSSIANSQAEPDVALLLAFIPVLVDGFIADVAQLGPGQLAAPGWQSAFVATLKPVLTQAAGRRIPVACFQDMISYLRKVALETLGEGAGGVPPAGSWFVVEDLLGQARVLVAETVRRMDVASTLASSRQTVLLNCVGHTLTTVADLDELGRTLTEQLPKLGITGCYLALYEDPGESSGWARLHYACYSQGAVAVPQEGIRFPIKSLLPGEILSRLASDGPYRLVAEPLFVRDKQFGFLLMAVGPRDLIFENQPDDATVYDALRNYISDALHGILLYEQAQHARQQAEEADRLKSRFLSMVSHELRTPLNVIVGVSEMLLWEQGGFQQELARIHASAQHLDGLIRDVLDLASSQVGQLRLVREPLDLRQVLEIVTQIGAQMAQDKGLRWVTEIPEALPSVWGDRTRLRQVALNLVSNAFRFTSEGEVTLRVETAPGWITVSVRDTGIGVPPDDQDVIFDEFRQSERTAQRGYGGLGLGLAISRRLVEMHGGTIGVHSSGKEGDGATFYFMLPTMALTQQVGSPSDDRTREKRRRVTILSSQAGSAANLGVYLSDRGYIVEEIPITDARSPDDPEHWLNQVLLNLPGAVILDAEPAKEYGWTLMRLLKENPETQNVPVLFYSLLQEDGSGSMLALDYLVKPVSVDDLTQVLDRQGMICDGAGSDACSVPTILVVDDEPGIVATHTWLIQSQLPHARVMQANNGRQALSQMAQTRPDLVLLDLMMPEMDGFEVLVKMHQHPDLCNIPVVVLTAKTLSDDEMDRLTLGVTTVLGKGLFSAEETLEHIEAALRRNNRSTTEETREIVRRAIVYIHRHYGEPLTRKEIAKGANLSARHLDRCFREQMGITPMAYLNRFRLRQSRRLLVSSPLNISEIAATVGFSDSGYFSRVFRRDMGMSPSEYRRTHS